MKLFDSFFTRSDKSHRERDIFKLLKHTWFCVNFVALFLDGFSFFIPFNSCFWNSLETSRSMSYVTLGSNAACRVGSKPLTSYSKIQKISGLARSKAWCGHHSILMFYDYVLFLRYLNVISRVISNDLKKKIENVLWWAKYMFFDRYFAHSITMFYLAWLHVHLLASLFPRCGACRHRIVLGVYFRHFEEPVAASCHPLHPGCLTASMIVRVVFCS